MLESARRPTRVDPCPTAASCASSRSVMQELEGLRQSSREIRLTGPWSESRDAFGGRGLRQPLFERERADAVHDGEDAALLEVERVALALGVMNGLKKPIGVGNGSMARAKWASTHALARSVSIRRALAWSSRRASPATASAS